MKPITLGTVIGDFGNLPSAPEVVTQLAEYLRQEGADIAVLAKMISRDPILAAKMLRLANSPAYGVQRRVSNIHDAVVVLGHKSIETMITAMAVTGRFQAVQIPGYDQRRFWLHNVGTAICARLLAKCVGANTESAFTAGLIHDIGKLVLAVRFPEHYAAVLDHQRQMDCRLLDAERTVLGFEHSQVGEALATEWKFTAEISKAVSAHHTPEDHPASTLASLIHLADIMSHILNFAAEKNNLAPRFSEFAWDRINIDWKEFKVVLAEADAQRQDADLLFA